MNTIIPPVASQLMDTLRGSAALLVAAVHSFQIFCLPYYGLYGFPHLFTSWLASYSVVIFFILSGFMIYFSTLKHTAEHNFQARSFFKARVYRIYPPLIAGVTISFIVYLLITSFELHGTNSYRLGGELFLSREQAVFEFNRVFSTLSLSYSILPYVNPPLSINGPLWSLSYEWWFYIFIMFAVYSISSKKFWAWIVTLFLFVIFAKSPSGALLRVLFAIWLSGFLLGYILNHRQLYNPKTNLVCAVTSIVIIFSAFLIGKENTFAIVAEPLQRYGNTGHYIMLCVALLITIAISLCLKYKWTLSWSKLQASSARYSYTLYVIHFPLLLLAFSILHPILHKINSPSVSAFAGLLTLLLVVKIASKVANVVENRVKIYSIMGSLLRNIKDIKTSTATK